MRRANEIVGIAVTILFIVWLLDTWTDGAIRRWARGWWADFTHIETIDVRALSETVVAEAIGITRRAAEGG